MACSRSCPPPWRSGPLEQAHLHTEASLNHHVGLGAWFAAIAAGYAVDRFIAAALAGRAVSCVTCVIALVFSLVALNFTDATGLERQIAADLRRNHHYHIIQVVPYGIEVPPIGQGTYIIWQYQASTRQAGYTPDSEPGRRRT